MADRDQAKLAMTRELGLKFVHCENTLLRLLDRLGMQAGDDPQLDLHLSMPGTWPIQIPDGAMSKLHHEVEKEMHRQLSRMGLSAGLCGND